MTWWTWFLLGAVIGIASFLVVGNTIAWARARGQASADGHVTYVATPGARRIVTFKGEDEAGGEEIGPVFVTDDDDPDFVHELGWMKISDAREVARALGHPFNVD